MPHNQQNSGEQPVPVRQSDLASTAWLVTMTITLDMKVETVLFAVAEGSAEDAVKAAYSYPGMLPTDIGTVVRRLSAAEIYKLRLRPGAARPYDRRPGEQIV